MPRLLIAVVCLTALAAGGCCCPPSPGRMWPGGRDCLPLARSCDPCGDECSPADCVCAGAGCQHCRHRPLLPHWLHRKPPVPSQQHADYVSPLPEYHPVPTRPVFEPLPSYTPPHLLDPPAKMHPMLHPHDGKPRLLGATSGYGP